MSTKSTEWRRKLGASMGAMLRQNAPLKAIAECARRRTPARAWLPTTAACPTSGKAWP